MLNNCSSRLLPAGYSRQHIGNMRYLPVCRFVQLVNIILAVIQALRRIGILEVFQGIGLRSFHDMAFSIVVS